MLGDRLVRVERAGARDLDARQRRRALAEVRLEHGVLGAVVALQIEDAAGVVVHVGVGVVVPGGVGQVAGDERLHRRPRLGGERERPQLAHPGDRARPVGVEVGIAGHAMAGRVDAHLPGDDVGVRVGPDHAGEVRRGMHLDRGEQRGLHLELANHLGGHHAGVVIDGVDRDLAVAGVVPRLLREINVGRRFPGAGLGGGGERGGHAGGGRDGGASCGHRAAPSRAVRTGRCGRRRSGPRSSPTCARSPRRRGRAARDRARRGRGCAGPGACRARGRSARARRG